MRVRRVIGSIGRLLIGSGLLIVLFVVYQLWGTGLAEARAQNQLRDEFARTLGSTTSTVATPTTAGGSPSVTTTSTTVLRLPPPPAGEAVAILQIPRIGLEKTVVEGVSVDDLKKGPGHYRNTPMPGQPGNVGIAGHRTTYGAPFHRIDELEPGDAIIATTRQGSFRYVVREQLIVRPSQSEVLDDFGDNRLTLTSCHPKYSAAQRIVVIADLVGPAAVDDIDELGSAMPDETTEDTTPDPDPSTVEIDRDPPSRAFDEASLSGDPTARAPALWWGLLATVCLAAISVTARRWRRWPAYLVGAPVFLVVLFVFFENFSRLLPANV